MFSATLTRTGELRDSVPRVLVIVAPVAKQLPVASIRRVVGVVVVLVVDGQLTEILAVEISPTAATNPGQKP